MDSGYDERGGQTRARAVMSRSKTYFLSDIHLGATYIGDTHAHQRKVVDFLRSIEADAKAVYLLGDVLDYWFEYRTVVPRGYIRFLGQLARMADMGIQIVWFTGNHDIWLSDYLRDEIGLELVDPDSGGIEREIDGTLFYLGHGDNFGRQPRSYRCLRALFHNKMLQKLFSGIHPRWTIPFAHAWSSHSRKGAEGIDALPEQALDNVRAEARRMSAANPELKYIVIGHLHVAVDETVGKNCRLIVTGNWINRSSYAVFDGKTLELREA